jgi:hypothetical protein
LEGELVGLQEDDDGAEIVVLRLPGDDVLMIPRDEISGAMLRPEWE